MINNPISWLLGAVAGLMVLAAPVSADTYLDSAKNYYEEKKFKSAIIELKNHLSENPESVEGKLLLADSELNTGDIVEAAKIYEDLLNKDLLSDEHRIILGELYLIMQQPAKAITLVSMKPFPNEYKSKALLLKGNAFLSQAMVIDAQEGFQQSLDLKKSSGAYIGLAKVKFIENKDTESMNLVDLSIGLEPDNTEALLLKAQLLDKSGEYEEAIKILSDLEVKDPNRSVASLRKVEILLKQGNTDVAMEVIEKILKNNNQSVQARHYRARVYLSNKEYKKSKDDLDFVLSKIPNHLPSMYLLAITHYQLNSKNQSRDLLNRYLSYNPDNINARLMLANIFLEQHDYEGVVTLLDSTGEDVSENPMKYALLGKAYIGIGDTSNAINYLLKAKELAPSVTSIDSDLATAYLLSNDIDSAIKELEFVAGSNAATEQTDALLVRNYVSEGRHEDAVNLIVERIKTYPDNPVYPHLYGAVFESKGKFNEANAKYKLALKKDDLFVPSVISIARIMKKQRQVDESISYLESFLNNKESSTNVSAYLANLYSELFMPVEQERVLLSALKSDSENVSLFYALSAFYLQEKNIDKAKIYGLKAINLQSDSEKIIRLMLNVSLKSQENHNVSYYFDRWLTISNNKEGVLKEYVRWLVSRNLNDEAIRIIDANTVNENFENLNLLKTSVYLKMGNHDKAKKIISDLLKEYPDNRDVIVAHARMTAEIGDLDGSLIWLEKHYETSKDSYFLEQAAAIVSLYRSDLEAINYYKKIIMLAPDSVVLNNNLAWILFESGDESAVAYGKNALELAPSNPQVLDTYGWILVGMGNLDDGVRYLRKAAVKSPSNRDIAYHLAYAMYESGDKEGAEILLQSILLGDKNFIEMNNAKSLLKKINEL